MPQPSHESNGVIGSLVDWSLRNRFLVACGTLLLVAAGMLRMAGLSDEQAVMAWLFGLAGYAIALHWFLARQGLGVTRGQAVLFILGVNLGTALLVFLPRQLGSGL